MVTLSVQEVYQNIDISEDAFHETAPTFPFLSGKGVSTRIPYRLSVFGNPHQSGMLLQRKEVSFNQQKNGESRQRFSLQKLYWDSSYGWRLNWRAWCS